ncbi:MAG: hypothetical protein ACTSVV_14335, partial [Promethearchaeota archaeon]
MSNDGEKRRRPNLYKKDDKEDDVLKKLKEVRQNLQESLNETPEKKAPTFTRKRGERRLYKKGEPEKEEITPKVSKLPKKEISTKRLALVQKRVKAKLEATKGLSKKKKALIFIWLVIMSIPLAFIPTLAVLGIEIDFTGFGLIYNENKPGTIVLSFPARNPSFLPMHLYQFEIKLYTEDGEYIGKATNNDELDIGPYQTEKLYITLALEEDTGGEWISHWLSTMQLKLRIGSMVYNGMEIDTSFIPTIEIDTTSILRDMITGLLDIEELLSDFNLNEMLGQGTESTSTQSEKIQLDPYANARKQGLLNRLQSSQIEGMDDMTLNVSFGMSENETEFRLGLSSTIDLFDLVSLEDLGGIVLGPIYLSNLDVQLRVSTEKHYKSRYDIENDEEWWTHYNYELAKLFTTKENKIFIADTHHRNSEIGMNLTIYKDEYYRLKNGHRYHPSADIDWNADDNDPYSLYNFLHSQGNFTKYMKDGKLVDVTGEPAWKIFPAWYFLHNILGESGLDCAIAIENADINIFGLDIKGVSLSMEILPPLYLDKGFLDPDNFLRYAPDYGLAGILKNFMKGISEGPARAMLGLPPSTSDNGIPPEKDVNSLIDDFVNMVEMGDLNLSSIEETWGPDAKLHMTLPILLNNSLINFYIGFSGMEVGIGTSIGERTLKFLSLKISGNNTDLVYLPGISNKKVPL